MTTEPAPWIASRRARLQRRYLRRFACYLCEQSLDRIATPADCCAIGHRCDQATIDQRRADCLAGYRPRSR